MSDVTMPRLSDSMEEGTILRWLVADGEEVTVGQELAEVETDKATMTFEAEAEGVVKHVASEGETVALGGVIARIVGPGDEHPTTNGNGVAAGAARAPAALDQPAAGAAAVQMADGISAANTARPSASPVARRLATRLNVNLGSLTGTGPRGRIVRADVEQAASGVEQTVVAATAASIRGHGRAGDHPARADAVDVAQGEGEVVELTRAQQVVARRMAESRGTVPDFDVSVDVDMEAAWLLREQLKASARDGTPTPSLNDFIVMACARTLAEQPHANALYRDGRVERHGRVNVGVAIADAGSLVVVTVPHADRRSLGEIGRATRALATKVRDGSITPPELSGATFTVSNLGMLGVDRFTAVINAPQVAILAVGAIAQRAVVRDGAIVARRTMTMTLAADHRVLYGADGARFLTRVKELLEGPLHLVVG